LIEEAPPLLSTPPAALTLARVYDEWFETVYRWLRALGAPESDAEDLTQEVFLVVRRKLASFDGRNLPGWLYGITARTASDHRRRRWFRSWFSRAREVELEELECPGVGPEATVASRQDQERFYRLVGKMSAKWRDSFVLFEVEGYSGDEIATLKGLSPTTVRVHLHRARKQFLALLEKEAP
jgi:RNA polymerase sigma-70 factor (ECF subfamily)